MDYAITGSTKRFILASAAIFAFIFVYELAVYNYSLSNLFEVAFGNLEKKLEFGHSTLSILLQLCLAFTITAYYSHLKSMSHESTKSFGIALGLFMAIVSASRYLYLPISDQIGMCWFLWSINEGFTIGFLLNFFYRPQKKELKTLLTES